MTDMSWESWRGKYLQVATELDDYRARYCGLQDKLLAEMATNRERAKRIAELEVQVSRWRARCDLNVTPEDRAVLKAMGALPHAALETWETSGFHGRSLVAKAELARREAAKCSSKT